MAVRLLSLLLEGALIKLLEAEGTNEMFWMKFLAHGRDASSGDGFLATGAKGSPPSVIVDLAVRLAVVFEVASTREGHQAFPATEALVMPLAFQGGHVIGGDGKITRFAPVGGGGT